MKRLIPCLLFVLCGCGASTQVAPPDTIGGSAVKTIQAAPQYMIGESAVKAIAADPIANAALLGTHPYIIQDNESGPYANVAPPDWGAINVVRWTSADQMRIDIQKAPTWVTTTMYDNEPGLDTAPSTPPIESANPAKYFLQATQLSHKSGRDFIATAGIANAATRQAVYDTATSWDGYDVQSQTGLNNLTQFTQSIKTIIGHVLAVNPNIKRIGAGIGDFAGGTLMTQSQIDAAARAVPSGYFVWLNFGPHSGPKCTDKTVCPIPGRVDLEIQLIKDLSK